MRVDVVARSAIAPPRSDAEVLWELHRLDRRRIARFTAHPSAGYVLEAVSYGRFHISADGSAVSCGPVRTSRDHWQRYLVGQILPFAAVVHGLEVFHTSVVRVGDRGVVFTSPSGGGKSTLAVALVLRGAELVADDVMAVDADDVDGPLLAHPGWGWASIRRNSIDTGGLGPVLGADEEAVRHAVTVAPGPVAVSEVYVVGRQATAAEPLIAPLDPVDPRILLSSSYNFVIRTPERLVRQLDVCARLARTAKVYRIAIPPKVGPMEVAAAVEGNP